MTMFKTFKVSAKFSGQMVI